MDQAPAVGKREREREGERESENGLSSMVCVDLEEARRVPPQWRPHALRDPTSAQIHYG